MRFLEERSVRFQRARKAMAVVGLSPKLPDELFGGERLAFFWRIREGTDRCG